MIRLLPYFEKVAVKVAGTMTAQLKSSTGQSFSKDLYRRKYRVGDSLSGFESRSDIQKVYKKPNPQKDLPRQFELNKQDKRMAKKIDTKIMPKP